MMNWVCCFLTYVFVLFLIYTPLDHSVVQSSPIPDGPQSNVDPNTGLPSDTDIAKNIVNIDANSNEVEQNVNRDQEDNIIIDGREEDTAENRQHDAEEADDALLNEDVKEGIVPGREDIGRNEQDAESQTALEDEVGGNVEHSVQEDGQSIRMSDHSAQKENLLPADPQEGHAVESGRNQGMPVDEELNHQNAKAAEDAAHDTLDANAVHNPDDANAVHNPEDANAIHNPEDANVVHSPEYANAVHNPEDANVVSNPEDANAIHNPEDANAVHNPEDANAIHNPDDANAVHSSQDAYAVHDPQDANAVHNPQDANAVHNPQDASAVHDLQDASVVHNPQDASAVRNSLKLNTVHEQQNMPKLGTEVKYQSENPKPNPNDINETLKKLGIIVDHPYVPKPDQTVGNPPTVQTIRSDGYQAERTSVKDTGSVQKDVIHQGLWGKPQTTQTHGNVDTAEHQSHGLEISHGGQIEQPFGAQSRQSYIPISQPFLQDHNSVTYSRDSQNGALSNNQQQSLSSQKAVDVPEEFNADSTSKEDPQADNHYSDDGYLDAPAENLDNDRNAQDKTDEDVNKNNNYDDSSDFSANLNNKKIIDDNNEQVLYEEENKKDDDESYENTLYDDKDDYSYEEKIDRTDGDETKPTTPSDRDRWYQGDTDDIVEGKESDVNDTDFVDTVIDEEVDFQRTHVKHPQTDDDDNSLYFSNGDTQIQEGVVEYKLIKNRNSLNAPSSMVLFYTWIILIVLIAVVTLSAFRYRCKGIINGQRNHRNGNHGNYRNGEESKKLLENVYT